MPTIRPELPGRFVQSRLGERGGCLAVAGSIRMLKRV